MALFKIDMFEMMERSNGEAFHRILEVHLRTSYQGPQGTDTLPSLLTASALNPRERFKS